MMESLKLGGILLLITTLCAGLLGFVNSQTAPIIIQGKEQTQTQAVKSLLPDFETVVKVDNMEEDKITTAFVTYKGDTYVGAVVKTYPEGYGGGIELLVGIEASGEVSGIQILSHQETPGLGANMLQDDFKGQFIDQRAPLGVSKTSRGEGEIMAITGATITSQAVTDGVNLAAEYIKINQEEWEKEATK